MSQKCIPIYAMICSYDFTSIYFDNNIQSRKQLYLLTFLLAFCVPLLDRVPNFAFTSILMNVPILALTPNM